jgi:hypothetical protein
MSETKIDALSIGAKYQTSAVGLVAKGKATYGQWEVALSVACGIAKSCPYWVGKFLIAGGLRSLVTVVGPARETPCTASANTDDAMYLHLP